MNSVIMCGSAAIAGRVAVHKKTVVLVFVCVLAAAMWLPVNVAAQADPAADQQQESQAQRNDLAAEVEALKREIEDIKAQLARITALQRLQTERILQQSQTSAPAQAAVQPPYTQPLGSMRQEPAPTAAPTTTSVAGENNSPTVFVFKDGTRTEAHNFAIVGGTLWIYTDQEAKKYAVSYIDVPATTAANATRGNKFQMPELR